MIEFTSWRNIDRALLEMLSTCFYIDEAANVLITGTAGTGTTFFPKAFAVEACEEGYRRRICNTRLLLKELVDTRWDRHSTIVCSQVAMDNWVSIFKNTALGHAIVGRLKAHRYSIELTGDDMRMAHTERPWSSISSIRPRTALVKLVVQLLSVTGSLFIGLMAPKRRC